MRVPSKRASELLQKTRNLIEFPSPVRECEDRATRAEALYGVTKECEKKWMRVSPDSSSIKSFTIFTVPTRPRRSYSHRKVDRFGTIERKIFNRLLVNLETLICTITIYNLEKLTFFTF